MTGRQRRRRRRYAQEPGGGEGRPGEGEARWCRPTNRQLEGRGGRVGGDVEPAWGVGVSQGGGMKGMKGMEGMLRQLCWWF